MLKFAKHFAFGFRIVCLFIGITVLYYAVMETHLARAWNHLRFRGPGEKINASRGCRKLWPRHDHCQNNLPRVEGRSAIFSDIFLAINYNNPFYKTIPLLKEYYSPVFPNFIICGPEISANYSVVHIEQAANEYGYYGYQCLVEAIRRNPGYSGYLYINDDMIVNWWNFLKLDKDKIWFPTLNNKTTSSIYTENDEFFWKRASALEKCKEVYQDLEKNSAFRDMKIFERLEKNLGQKGVCIGALSDIVYIPTRLSKAYELIGQKFYDHRTFLEVSTPMTIHFIEDINNVIIIDGLYLQMKYGWGTWTQSTVRAWNDYNFHTTFLHPYKFHGNNKTKHTKQFRDRVLCVSDIIREDMCLDVLSLGQFWKKASKYEVP